MPVRVSGTEAPFLPFPADVTPVSRACADRGRRQRSASMRSRHLQDAARHPSANSRLLRGAVSTRPPQEVRSSRDFIRRINKYLISFLNYDKPNKLFSNAQRGRLVRGENVVALRKKKRFFSLFRSTTFCRRRCSARTHPTWVRRGGQRCFSESETESIFFRH